MHLPSYRKVSPSDVELQKTQRAVTLDPSHALGEL